MPYDRHLIAPIDKGLQTGREPFLIPENAFSKLHNAYVFRDRVVKRFGGSWLVPSNPVGTVERRHLQSRLRMQVNTVTSNAVNGTVDGAPYQPGCCFSIGNVIFTVDAQGTPMNMKRTDGVNATQDFDTTTGDYNITNVAVADGTPVYFYPGLPVMGLKTYEQTAINDEFSIAFDTKFAYRYDADGWERLGNEEWSGTNSDFFWTTNWRGTNPYDRILYATNNVNRIRYWAGGTNWTDLHPIVSSVNGDTLESALIIVPFKGRLLALNTLENTPEGNNRFRNRCRFSQVGDPFEAGAWDEEIVGRGGYIDAPVNQAITSVAFLKDRLVVSFERRYFELAYTGNQVLPFVWQEINSELGVESTFSNIEFDNSVLGIADVGVHACVGTGVQRIDQDIPDYIFEIHNQNEGVNRVHGIREFFTEMAYWTLPKENRDAQTPWPNRVLGYNYINRTWSTHDDSITTFGYFQPDESLRWESAIEQWQVTDDVWSSGQLQANIRKVVAGNQTGYTFTVEPKVSRNSAVLLISNIINAGGGNTPFYPTIQVEDHNLQVGDYILVENIRDGEGPTELNGQISEVDEVVDKDNFKCAFFPGAEDNYLGGGTIARVSRVDIETKDFNFYLKEGIRSYLQRVEFLTDRTEDGEMQVDFYTTTSRLSLGNEADATDSSLGDYVLDMYPYEDIYPYEETQSLLWHPVYFQADGSFFRLRLYYNDLQMQASQIALSDFRLHAMIFYTKPTSLRMG